MKMSARGRQLLTQREGVRLKAYKDSVGVWTIGIGHTSAAGAPKVTPNLTITREEADEIFARDLIQYENAVNRNVKVKLLQNEFDALVSFCYNIGPAGFARSTVVKLLNEGNKKGAAKAFMNWVKPPELRGRRTSEMNQFLTPYPGSTAETGTVVGTGGAGTALALQFPDLLPYIIAGTIAAAIIGFVVVRWYKKRKEQKYVEQNQRVLGESERLVQEVRDDLPRQA